MHVPINVKSPNNISEWQMGFNSAYKGFILFILFHNCWNLQMCWIMDGPSKKNVFPTSLGITYTTCHHEGI